jgi:WD40 repeat protein
VAHCLTHDEPVYAACFSPDSKYVATGTAGSLVHIWSVAQGALVTSYDTGGGGSSLEVAWSRVGDKLAVSNNNKTITVCDVRRL